MITVPNPVSENEWRSFVRDLIRMEGGYLLDRLGSVSEIVRTTLRDATHPSAEDQFEVALDFVISMWRPEVPMAGYARQNILELIAAFTPPTGFMKILGQLELAGALPRYPSRNASVEGEGEESLREALWALRAYFTVPPAVVTPGFRAYESLLLGKLSGSLGPCCLRRLIELHLLELSDRRFGEVLSRDPEGVFSEMLQLVIDSENPRKEKILTHLFVESDRAEGEDLYPKLERVMCKFKCEVQEEEQGLVLHTPFERIAIDLGQVPRLLERYMLQRYDSSWDDSIPQWTGGTR